MDCLKAMRNFTCMFGSVIVGGEVSKLLGVVVFIYGFWKQIELMDGEK